MSSALSRLAVRTLLLAVVLAIALPLVSAAQESADTSDQEVVQGDEEPSLALPATPEPPPATAQPTQALPTPTPTPKPLPSHDWRSVGYVSVVEGKLYDPFCRPLRSVGSNVSNLLFRD